MDSFLLGIELVILYIVWKYMWQKTLLDATRDSLFDLRDGARYWFIENGYALDHEMYISLRKIINYHLRNIEKITIPSILAHLIRKKIDKEYDKNIGDSISSMFSTDDKKLSKYLTKIRWEAGIIVFLYSVKRSMTLSFIFFIFTVFVLLRETLRYLLHKVLSDVNPVQCTYKAITVGALMAFLSFISPGNASNIRMERFSVSQVTCQQQIINLCSQRDV